MCIEGPKIDVPTLGGALSLAPPSLPPINVGLDVCCKHVQVELPAIAPFPPGVFNVGAALALNAALKTVNEFLDKLPPDCPLE